VSHKQAARTKKEIWSWWVHESRKMLSQRKCKLSRSKI